MRKHIVVLFGLMIALAFVPFSVSLVAAQDEAMELTATLTGAEEVPDPGDPDGAGTGKVSIRANNEVCFELDVSNITLPATGAHIHEGAAGVAGPIVVPFTAPDASGKASGCTAGDAAVVARIRENPGNFYINVHTSDFPPGAVRGQLIMQQGGAAATTGPAATTAPAATAAPAGGDTPSSLPDTGSSGIIVPLLGLALLTLAAGLAIAWSERRRVRTH